MKTVFFQITIPPGAYEIETLNNENERILFMLILQKLVTPSQSIQISQH